MHRYYKLSITLIVFTLINITQALAQSENYQYHLDLTNPQNDQLLVTLNTPVINQKSIKFFMPKIIPGTYRESDYGLFVSDLKAFDKRGRSLPVERLDTNTWQISKADKMVKVTYLVEDIFDTEKENQVYMMSATNIEAAENYVIHTPGFFGYFEGMKEQPFEINITKPENLYGSTGLIPVSSSPNQDVYRTGDYDLLVDSPMMYNVPDTTFIEIGNARVLISVYSPKKLVTSEYLASKFETLLKATAKYIDGGLPVEKYAFILYFADPATANPRQGALEHSYSSFYYISETPQQQIAPLMVDIAAHEFFHIVTPLTIHSTEIANFNFNEPDLSKHLWLYEGVTEYSSDHVQVRYNLITPQAFMDKLAEKINKSKNDYDDNLPFTELSEKAAGVYSDQYSNVYEKGALIAAMLDVRLLELSEGEMDLQDLLRQLTVRYGKERPFDDDKLFEVIESMTYPEIGEYFRKYVGGPESIPYEDILRKVGVNYIKEPNKQVASIGQIGIGYNPEKERLEISNTEGMNAFGRAMGYQAGDLIISINEEEVGPETAHQVFEDYSTNTKAGDTVTMVIERRNDSGVYEKINLSAPAVLVETVGQVRLELMSDPTFEQLKLRNQWIQANPVTARPEDVNSIDAIINTLYEVISGPAGERDWERFRALFTPDAKMAAFSLSKSKQLVYKSMTPEEYQEQNAPFFLQSGFWERELGREEMKFGELATVFSAYEFSLTENGAADQKGINSIQLVYDQNRWWIANLIWNSEREQNKIPEALLNK